MPHADRNRSSLPYFGLLSRPASMIDDYSHRLQASIDTFLYLPALLLPAIKAYKGYMAPLAWISLYFWLTAFIFASQDYNFGSCAVSPSGVNKCALKKTIEAFASIAFFTNVVGQLLEARLWDIQHFKNRAAHPEKHAGTTGTATATPGESTATATA
nr:hypothetical protein LTR18_002334 [Exophiala xenobiotica]